MQLVFIVIGFLMGDAALQCLPVLPSGYLVFLLLITSACFGWLMRRHYFGWFLFVILIGFAWSAWYASSTLSWSLPEEWEGKNLWVTGKIISLPERDAFGGHFIFQLHSRSLFTHPVIKLSWRDAMTLKVEHSYRLLVRLKRVHGTQNPGSFDYEAWALQNGIRVTGQVISHPRNRELAHEGYDISLNPLREYLRTMFHANQPSSPVAPWLLALMIGERGEVNPADWDVLRKTGTNHLMAIGGLHIGMLAGWMHFLVSRLWRLNRRLLLGTPASIAGAAGALIASWVYGALSGFSLPAERACLMLTVYISLIFLKRQVSSWQAWSLAMLIVLLLNPLTVLSESFWLSFGTIALIIYGVSSRLQPHSLWWRWGRTQWVIGIGLTPLTLYFFQQCSLVFFLANSIAIPWLGLFILPFCLMADVFLLIFPPAASLFLWIADKSLVMLWGILTGLSHLDMAVWTSAMPSGWIMMLTMAGVLMLLSPAGFPGRWLGLLWITPLVLFTPQRPAEGTYSFTLLDVGQGLSVVVETRNHTLVYDAGPRFSANFDMGDSVVAPYLRLRGIRELDKLIISHGDNDHIGGAYTLLNQFHVRDILTSVPYRFGQFPAEACLSGTHWRWDGVNFEFLYPVSGLDSLGNDSSCVLKIDNGHVRMLLPGDIEKFAEHYLVSNDARDLQADVLVAAHHGSKTSSTTPFLDNVHPAYVLFATGYRNRYHFPNQTIVNRFSDLQIIQLNSAASGAIQFDARETLSAPRQYRILHQRYWY